MAYEESTQIEKFTATDLSSLREELTQSGLDSWQAAELVASFLTVRGYGASPIEIRKKNFTRVRELSQVELQEKLEALAKVA